MDDSCAVCAETLEWVAYGACGHKDVCSTCVARLRFICNDRRCCICKTEATVVFVTKALGEYTRMINDFTVFPYEPKEGRIGSHWYHEDTQAFFDDLDHYKMIRAMCKLSCSVCDKMEGPDGDGMKKRARFRNIEQLKGHLFHQHKLLMCSLCLEGRKVFICEQKLYTRAQLNQHIDTGDSEVDGTESERGGFMGHPLCEFCRTPFYGDNELYSHMSTEHYTCHICQRQHPGQYEYYKNYDDLEIHFRSNHFLCEDESCLAKKFVVFQSETELKRHNTLEHGGRMSRSQRSAALQIPTSFQYRRSNEQDSRRRGRSFRRDNSENELVMAIQASLEAANADGRPRDTSSNRRAVSDYAETNDEDFLIASFESLATDSVEPASRYRQAVSQASGNSQLQESSFPPLAVPPATNQPRPQSDALPKNTMASRLRGKQNKTTKPSSSSPAWPATGHTPPVIGHQHAWPMVSSASGSSSSSRHSKSATDDPSAPVITTQHAWPAVNGAIGSASGSSQIKPPSSSSRYSKAATDNPSAPVITREHAWPAVSGATGSTSGSSQIKLPSSSSRYSKAATDNPSAPVITREHAWPAVGGATGSTSGSSQIKPSTVDGPPPSSYLSSVAALSSLVHEASSSSVGSSKNWYQSNRISHSTSAPNLVQSGSFDSSVSDFPPVSAVQTRKLPASGQQAVTNVEDVQTANKSLVERMRLALQFDQDKFAAFKDISAEYRQGIIDAETYLAYVEQFGLSHLILELARLCPDAERQKELIDTFNANLGGAHKQKELIDTTALQNFQSGGNQLKDGNSSKKGKGKLLDAGNGTSKGSVADNIISTVRKLQSSHKIPEDDVEVLSKDGYRSTKAKSKLTLSESEELNSRGEPLRLQARQNGLSARDESNHSSGNNDGKSKQRKKTSKFHRVRLGDGSVETLLNLKSSDPEADPDRKEISDEHSDPPEGLPVRGVWRNGGGHKLVAMTSKGPKK